MDSDIKELGHRLEQLVNTGIHYISNCSDLELNQKLNPKKWSKKEIFGHLIDSGINNLQRFTEIQFEPKPFKIKTYNQDALVLANDYQNSDSQEIATLWKSLNHRIKSILEAQSENTLNYDIVLPNGRLSDLRFLFKDYVDHLEHHMNQIIK